MNLRFTTRARRRTSWAAVVATAALAGGLLTVPTATAAAGSDVTGPVFEDGKSQAVFDDDPSQWIREELWVEAPSDSDRDGSRDRIHVSLARPRETASAGVKVPVVYEDSPYYAGLGDAKNWQVDHPLGQPPTSRPPTPYFTPDDTSPVISTAYESTWIPRGFAVVHSESPGTGLSQGCPTSGGRNETLAPKAVIDWLNGRARAFTTATATTPVTASWTTGKVGMTGTSYNGTLPEAVATTGVRGLAAIVPVSAISSWYDYYRANGLVRAPGGYQGEDLDVLADAVYSRVDRTVCQPVIEEIARKQDRVSGDYSAFWRERDYMQDVGKVRAATLVAHGLDDWNVMAKNADQFYQALKKNHVPHQIYLHQGGHGGPPTDDMMNRWFTRYLYGVRNGVEDGPKAFIVREGDPRSEPTAYADFPDPRSRVARLGLRPGGAKTGGLVVGHRGKGARETLVDDASVTAQSLIDAPASAHRLAYLTGPLRQDVRISGTPVVDLRLGISARRANLTAVLVQYGADGTNRILTRGWMDPRNRRSDSREVELPRGRPAPLRFDLQPKDSVIPAGSRIGVVVLSSDNEFTVRPPKGTRLTLDTGRSGLRLPVVGGARVLDRALG